MTERTLHDWLFELELPQPRDGAWWFSVVGRHRRDWGPYPSASRAEDAVHAVFQRWQAAARARGGWAWKATPRRWVVTLPRGCLTDGLPFRTEACTRHTG